MQPKLPLGHFYGDAVSSCEVAGFLLTENSYPAGARLPAHSHEQAYLCFVRQGAYTEVYGTRTRTCRPSNLVIHPPGEEHSEQFHGARGRLLSIEVEPRLRRRLGHYTSILDRSVDFQRGPLCWLALRLYNEFHQPDEVAPLAMEALILEIISEASRHGEDKRPKPPRWLQQAADLLHEQFNERLSLRAVACSVGAHPVHLSREFRRHYRCTVGDYVRRLRVEYACRELSASDAGLTEIALRAGFSDQAHFTRTFKRFTGVTPARFRASARSR